MIARLITLLGAVFCFAVAYGCYDFSRYIGSSEPLWGWVMLWAAALVVVEGVALVCLSLRRWR